MSEQRIVKGDCVERLNEMPAGSVDAVITDPPYGIAFMGHEWDQPGIQTPAVKEGVPPGQRRQANPKPSGIGRDGVAMEAGRYDLSRSANQAFQEWCGIWAGAAYRVLKPGGHIAAFGAPRTAHRLACAIEDAGFEMRDSLMWMFAQGFPKSLNLERFLRARGDEQAAAQWAGWGTALKPAYEPIILARKPLPQGGVAANLKVHGTGAINIDACRIATDDKLGGGDTGVTDRNHHEGYDRPWMHDPEAIAAHAERVAENVKRAEALGRWPANVVLSHTEDCELVGTAKVKAATGTAGEGAFGTGVTYGNGAMEPTRAPTTKGDADGMEVVEVWDCASACPVRLLDEHTGALRSGVPTVMGASGGDRDGNRSATFGVENRPAGTPLVGYGDVGGASRFFYTGKSSRAERNAGLDGFEEREILWSSGDASPGTFQSEGTDRKQKNHHPTVKPLDLMRWLVRLLTPPGGLVVDLFAGSGTTGCACALEGMDFVGVERDLDKDGNEAGYIRIAEARIRFWASKPEGIETKRVLRAEADKPENTGQLSIL